MAIVSRQNMYLACNASDTRYITQQDERYPRIVILSEMRRICNLSSKELNENRRGLMKLQIFGAIMSPLENVGNFGAQMAQRALKPQKNLMKIVEAL